MESMEDDPNRILVKLDREGIASLAKFINEVLLVESKVNNDFFIYAQKRPSIDYSETEISFSIGQDTENSHTRFYIKGINRADKEWIFKTNGNTSKD